MITEQEWHATNLALKHQAEEAEIARYREWRSRTEKKLRAARAAEAAAAAKATAKTPPPPADSGPGWSVIPHPLVPHEALERHMLEVWSFAWHFADPPVNWRFRWGRLDDALLSVAGAVEGYCAAQQRGRVLGLCAWTPKIVLISEENQQGRTPKQFGMTLLHELTHILVRSTIHGERFRRALESASDYFFESAAAPAPALAPPWRPTPRVGVRYPFPDSQIEYRG